MSPDDLPSYSDGYVDGYHAGWRACLLRAAGTCRNAIICACVVLWVLACVLILGKVK